MSEIKAKTSTFTAKDLMAEVIPPVKWVVPGILAEGLTVLGGKPKKGKSWMALDMAIAVATGGEFLGRKQLQQGDVLYLALEDNKRRLQDRIDTLITGDAPDTLHLATEWSRLDQGGLNDIEKWIKDHPNARLIVIDTFEKVRKQRKSNANIYAEDYAACKSLKALADKHGLAILFIHHLRKEPAADPLDEVSGSTGLTGAVDGAMLLKRKAREDFATLYVVGRDIDEKELWLEWNSESARWSVSDSNRQMSLERKEIREVIIKAGKPLAPKEISEMLGKKRNSVKQLLWKMVGDDQITALGDGLYTLNNQ